MSHFIAMLTAFGFKRVNYTPTQEYISGDLVKTVIPTRGSCVYAMPVIIYHMTFCIKFKIFYWFIRFQWEQNNYTWFILFYLFPV